MVGTKKAKRASDANVVCSIDGIKEVLDLAEEQPGYASEIETLEGVIDMVRSRILLLRKTCADEGIELPPA